VIKDDVKRTIEEIYNLIVSRSAAIVRLNKEKWTLWGIGHDGKIKYCNKINYKEINKYYKEILNETN
jgi:hypothetical protein